MTTESLVAWMAAEQLRARNSAIDASHFVKALKDTEFASDAKTILRLRNKVAELIDAFVVEELRHDRKKIR